MDRQKEGRRLRLYGLTAEQYDALVLAQDGHCAMCRETPDRLVIDHCHRTGAVRALLCDRCNRLLGVADDQVDLLRAAIRFLNKHQT